MRRGSILDASGQATSTLKIAETPDEGEAFLDDLIALHQRRWQRVGKPGCFAARWFTAFHRTLVRRWVPQGRVILARIGTGESPLAVIYGFVNGRKFDFYQTGTSVDSQSIQSPGIAAHALLMRALIGRGVDTYDFLRGSAEYKRRLSTGSRPIVDITVVRPGLPTLA